MGDVVLQFGPEPCIPSPAPHTAIVYKQEGLVVVVQTTGVPGCILDVVLSRKAALKRRQDHRIADECTGSSAVQCNDITQSC